MATRSSTAKWEGDLKTGNGTMTVGHGVFTGSFSFASRFEEGTGTNPEELIAAAHAGCFSMALSNELAKAGHPPTRVESRAVVHLGPDPAGGMHIGKIELFCQADVPGLEDGAFQEIAEGARKGCPVSKLYQGAEIVLQASLKK
jgi:osmotically inducible protein OsmC